MRSLVGGGQVQERVRLTSGTCNIKAGPIIHWSNQSNLQHRDDGNHTHPHKSPGRGTPHEHTAKLPTEQKVEHTHARTHSHTHCLLLSQPQPYYWGAIPKPFFQDGATIVTLKSDLPASNCDTAEEVKRKKDAKSQVRSSRASHPTIRKKTPQSPVALSPMTNDVGTLPVFRLELPLRNRQRTCKTGERGMTPGVDPEQTMVQSKRKHDARSASYHIRGTKHLRTTGQPVCQPPCMQQHNPHSLQQSHANSANTLENLAAPTHSTTLDTAGTLQHRQCWQLQKHWHLHPNRHTCPPCCMQHKVKTHRQPPRAVSTICPASTKLQEGGVTHPHLKVTKSLVPQGNAAWS